MEYSVYYFHSNRYTKIFNFVRNDKIINICASYYTDIDNEPDEEFEFNISIEELKSCKKLYEYYILSLFLTFDIHQLSYHMGDNEWSIQFQKNWKGLYFTDYYSAYVIPTYPEKILFNIDEEQTNYYKDCIEESESDEYDYLSKYLETNLEKVIKKMEDELFTIEGSVCADPMNSKSITFRAQLAFDSGATASIIGLRTVKNFNINNQNYKLINLN
jgi:hypothetical protein